jgi:hypothetical protein
MLDICHLERAYLCQTVMWQNWDVPVS